MGEQAGPVVVIEDDADLRAVVLEFLGASGFDTVGFSNARDALAALRRPDRTAAVILLDLEMPGMTGWEFRREQLRDPQLAQIPVVVASAADPGSIEANAYLPKPYEGAELCRVLAALSVRTIAA